MGEETEKEKVYKVNPKHLYAVRKMLNIFEADSEYYKSLVKFVDVVARMYADIIGMSIATETSELLSEVVDLLHVLKDNNYAYELFDKKTLLNVVISLIGALKDNGVEDIRRMLDIAITKYIIENGDEQKLVEAYDNAMNIASISTSNVKFELSKDAKCPKYINELYAVVDSMGVLSERINKEGGE